MDIKDELFKGKTFSDLMSDVYHNSRKKDRQINQLISQLQPLIRSASDATIIVPLIKEYLDVAVKNDDQLVKIANVVTKILTAKSESADEGILTDKEKSVAKKLEDKYGAGTLSLETGEIQPLP